MSAFRRMLLGMLVDQPTPPTDHLLEGYISTAGGSFTFKINWGTTITVTADSNGYWYWDNPDGINITILGAFCAYKTELTSITFGAAWNAYTITNINQLFNGCTGLTSISGLDYLNLSQCTDMSYAFQWCSSLTSLDLSLWDTTNVINISGMFYGCNQLTLLLLNNFTTSQIQSSSYYSNFCPDISTLTINYNSTQWNTSIKEEFDTNTRWVDISE